MEPTTSDVPEFLTTIPDARRRADAESLVALMTEVTSHPAVLWGTSIIGFGSRHYRYETGTEGVTVAVGFSPRKAQTVLYLTGSLDDYADLLTTLGKHSTGKSCLYLKRVDEADPTALRAIIARSYRAAGTDGGE
ncbi:DUF1801 domain-containing protein [Actinokineospora globicatena]|uniref:DUF1801 domain-containing protein n=1 Tax=Actinokineospora globicatena TaxID=103729 RepID=UPI0020A5B626|nr:DUF1801 domain-containing protein [Actinokineospora globicatena]MCP2304656.1 protein of unknown function (DU1801) [Actinokineospora globicatena]GLW77970.1 hypothetical protein Aglo01_24520 [Actinokineospora globicatena]GLW85363.1 hypothetical protein Aglo02_30030 [Actinokineospora globicatena]